jgi:hypothetical protein
MQTQQSHPYILPDKTVVFFRERAERNERASEKAAAPRYDRVVVAALRAPGQRSSEYCFEAARFFPEESNRPPKESPELDTERVIRAPSGAIEGACRVRQVYELWRKEQTQADSGMPLEMWAAIDIAQVAALKHVNVYTVEQLATLPDGFLPNTGLGMNAREIRAKAQAFLAHAAGAGKVEALAARVERFESALAEKDAEIAQLRAENARLSHQKPETRSQKPEGTGPSAASRHRPDHARTQSDLPPAQAEHLAPPAPPPRGAGGRLSRKRNDPGTDDVAGDVQAALAEAGGVGADEDGDFV